MLFSCYSRSLASSSLTCSTIFALSSIKRLVLSIIFLKSITFYFTELAIMRGEAVNIFTHFFNLHQLVTIVIVVDTFNANLDRACLAKVLNHLMRMPRARYALEVTEQQRHCLLAVNEIKYFLVLSAFICCSFNNGLIVIWTLGESLMFKHVFDACFAESAPALVKN